jgi:hypothetical protein
MEPVLVMVEEDAALAMPKSVTFTSPDSVMRMLCGFMSRWITPRSWAARRASAIWSATAAAVRAGNAPLLMIRSFRVPPGRYSIAM